MGTSDVSEVKRKLTDSEREAFLRIKKRLAELQIEDMALRAELDSMGLEFERKWWHGSILNSEGVGETEGATLWMGKPLNFEID